MKYLVLLLLFTSLILVTADDDFGEDGGESEFGEGLGSAATAFLWIGAIYVFVRRIYILIKTYDILEEDIKNKVKELYFTTRPFLYTLHAWALIISTILAIIHGFFLFNEFNFVQTTGLIAVVSMIIASISGFLIWRKVRIIWSNKTARTFVRTSHRQWAISVVLLISLALHGAAS